jgi:hypothetical protein
MQLLDDIRKSVIAAEHDKKKAAMIHSLVLIHAAQLEGVEPLEFCRRVGLQDSYQREFQKMLAASRVLTELGYSVQKDAKA